MSYVPPHARKATINTMNKNTMNKNTMNKNTNKPKNTFEQDFPQLVANNKATTNAMDFSHIINIKEEVPKQKENEMKKGFVKLTKNGVIDSLTEEERKDDEDNQTKKKINLNMINLYNHIEKTKNSRIAWESNYVPEVVVDEYSSSEYYSSEESDEYAEDPEDEFNEL